MKKVLITTRPFTTRFTKLYKNELQQLNIYVKSISEFKYFGDYPFVKERDLLVKSKKKITFPAELQFEERQEIITRCRYLRALNIEKANSIVVTSYTVLDKILDHEQFDTVISLPCDNYFLHILYVLCKKKGISFTTPLASMLPKHTRITSMGEHFFVRTPNADEIKKTVDKLSNKQFKPDWLNKHRSKVKIFQLYLKERIKKIIFELLKIILNDKNSFHFNTIFPLKGVITVRSIRNIFSESYFTSREEALNQIKQLHYNKIIYFPLQFTPETSLNYYINDHRFSAYDALIETVINTIGSDNLIIFKEHPDIFGFRDVSFYENLKSKPNVLLVSMSMNTDELLHYSDVVLVTGSASTGIEAAIKGKPLISLGGCFYSTNGIYEISDFDQIGTLKSILYSNLTKANPNEVAIKLLSNTLPGDYYFLNSKSSKDRDKISVKTVITFLAAKTQNLNETLDN